MKTWSREPVLGLFLWGLAFTLPRPLGAETPINSSPDAGTTAVYSASGTDEASSTEEKFTSFTSPSSESSSAPSQEDLLLTRSSDTEQTQTQRETSTRSPETVGASTEPFTSSSVGTSSEPSSSSRDWRVALRTQNLPDVSTGVSSKTSVSSMSTEDSSLWRDSSLSHLGDVVSSPSQAQILTDSIFTSTAISRAGERALLSVTSSFSNKSSSSSSSAFTERSSSHQPLSTWSIPSTGGAETEDYTHSASSTRNEETSSLTQSSFPETSTGTQTLVGPPNATEHQHILTSEATSHSTPTIATTDQLEESFSFTPPVVPPVRSPTLVSYQEPTVETTAESSTRAISFSTQSLSWSTDGSSSKSEGEIVGFISTTAPPSISSTTNRQDTREETTEVFITTAAVTVTERFELTEDTSTSTVSTRIPLLAATSSFRLLSTSVISNAESPTRGTIPFMTPGTTDPTLAQQSSAAPTVPLSYTSQAHSSPVVIAEPTDVTTSKQETSAATLGVATPGVTSPGVTTPGVTTPGIAMPTQGQPTTAPHALRNPTRSTEAASTTRKQTDRVTTGMAMATTTTHVLPTKAAPTRDPCVSNPCMNGGTCTSYERRQFTCTCQEAWTGPTCTQDADECEKDPCPVGSRCVNTRGSFDCECPLGFDLENGRTCTKAKTFLGTFRVNGVSHDPIVFKSAAMHEIQREIMQLLNASLSHLRGYSRSTLSQKEEGGVHISAVNMFSTSSDVTSAVVHNSIQTSLKNCNASQSHCLMVLQHRLTYHVERLCVAQRIQCNPERSACTDVSGTAQCQCLPGYYKHNLDDLSCFECGDGYKLENGTCVPCMFGFGGFNCGNFYKLIAVVVSPAGGALLLILIIALIVTCCKKDKNDLNKIIFKSGDLQMSPYADFPKSNRISMEWGRETIEMQENGSTKNLLQMTDIYYSPALRNSDLERNGLYPFTGLPGSRHSCIYPAQWNPSFISDDSRRRDYF
ncbi:protein HEG isoform X2 [Hippocampus comes]|uniref:protein HEG isoform X2 n=1 Tax=Hippocampus comes TaxID=109280 RepID=UPI00094ED1CF|nr:PREDICTED: protein HEG homolog 1 isoform X2 [Hippocampus comes]